MSYSVALSPNFKKEAKRLVNKYPSLKSELKALFEDLEKILLWVTRWVTIFIKFA